MKCLATGIVLPLLLMVGCSKPPESTTPTAAVPAAPSAEVQKGAIQIGKSIAAETFSLLSSNLQAAIQQGGVSNALPFCSLAASPLTAGMAGKHGVTIRRMTHKSRNPADRADTTELAILNHFAAALTGTNPPPPLVTNLTSSTATFFAPIILNNELCLKCHGEPGKDISAENVAIIQRLYPQDDATGFKLGQLRGAWRIDIPVATLPRTP
ncbi:MAG: DUF3365 domain-containing protein [Verrucomicrobia subdivision 3 bacterium]|nr:DUF3365 domain-containing protein [Limisphaerales bacterium]